MFSDKDLYLPAEGRLPWKKNGKKPTSQCRPQLRLFTTELAFLTLVFSQVDIKKCVVVYAGAARGYHIPALASLYPGVPFYLYDPHEFAISATPQITIFRDRFTDRLAEQWRATGRTIVFISDIRSLNKTDRNYEAGIGVDMETQARWVEIMKPVWWSLKFRIPYPIVSKGEIFVYLPGWLMFQPFGKNLSMEMRLIGQSWNTKGQNYDTRDLEQQLYYHNTCVRPDLKRFASIFAIDGCSEFDNGYDCSYFFYVIKSYLSTPYAPKIGEEDVMNFINNLIAWIGC